MKVPSSEWRRNRGNCVLKGRDVVALTVRGTRLRHALNIRDAAKAALDEGFTHYAPVVGIPELREAIATKLKTENNLPYPCVGIVLANGTKQAIANAVLSVIGPGDEVIILAPYWVSYEATVRLAGGTPVVLSSSVDEESQGAGPAHRRGGDGEDEAHHSQLALQPHRRGVDPCRA